MKEIEILVPVYDSKEKTLKVLKKFTPHGVKQVTDIYFYDPQRSDLQPDAHGRLRNSFRLRKKDNENLLTYKNDHFDERGVWLYSDERETTVGDFEVMVRIVEGLGYKELVHIDNEKHIFTSPDYEIVLEDVKDLGLFLEVEKLHEVAENEITPAKEKIHTFILELGIHIGDELNMGKPELMLAKQRGFHATTL